MTKTQVSTGDRDARMSPEAQRIKIAEVLGWKRGQIEDYSFADPSKKRYRESWIDPRGIDFRKLPDYLNDLNAMHEAEKVLTEKQRNIYADQLSAVLGLYDDYYEGISFYEASKFIYATSAQRAEAFLKTLKRWKPDQSEKRDL